MNRADEKRIKQFYKVGCIACSIDGHHNPEFDVHHLISGYRIGHHATIPLCPWHHRGVCQGSTDAAKLAHGPSLKWHPREFTARYGSQAELLDKVNALL